MKVKVTLETVLLVDVEEQFTEEYYAEKRAEEIVYERITERDSAVDQFMEAEEGDGFDAQLRCEVLDETVTNSSVYREGD